MHYVQKRILDDLRLHDSMRYVDLNSYGIESGHFRYHLNQLVKDGYVAQLSRGLYSLSDAGQNYVDRLSQNQISPHEMPKIITYTLLTQGNRVLLYQKEKQPYKGMLNMVGGKLHVGETAQAAAIREVVEKTGIIISSPLQKGVFEILTSKEDELFTHAIAYVFAAEVNQDVPLGSLKQVSIIALQDNNQLAPDFLPVFNAISSSNSPIIKTILVAM